MNSAPASSVLIVDGTAVAYRAYYAIRGLTTRDGTPTNALFGFIRMLRQLEKQWRPDRLVVVFDGGTPPRRRAACPEYKAQRPPMPAELRVQLELVNQYLDAAGIPRLLLPQQEADDVIATLAARAADHGATVRLATSDKDLMQLVNDRIRIVPPTQANEEMGPEAVAAKTGVRPEQIVDWLALIGDSSDNIPGVDGVGPKTATKLIAQFGSLSACLAQADQIQPEGLRAKVQAGRAIAERNVQLMQLDCQVPGVPPWNEIPAPAPDPARLREFFQKYELHQFAAELAAPAPASAPPPPPASPPAHGQMSLF